MRTKSLKSWKQRRGAQFMYVIVATRLKGSWQSWNVPKLFKQNPLLIQVLLKLPDGRDKHVEVCAYATIFVVLTCSAWFFAAPLSHWYDLNIDFFQFHREQWLFTWLDVWPNLGSNWFIVPEAISRPRLSSIYCQRYRFWRSNNFLHWGDESCRHVLPACVSKVSFRGLNCSLAHNLKYTTRTS